MTASPMSVRSQLGPYQIVNLVGVGGMGEVYRARDSRLRREVAIKVLPPGYGDDPELLKRLAREARTAGQLNHPNIVAVYDVGSEDGVEYVVMEMLEGETLGSKLESGRLSPRKALDYAAQIAHGLAAAHEKDIIHRDLKPDNIFITRDGRVKILDFGLARENRPEDILTRLSSRLTTPGMVMGTAAYMSPEQARGQVVDHRSDIFAFGVTLYEMLSGKLPFEKETAVETMTAIINGEPQELAELVPGLPPVVYRVVSHCLEKSPDQRFQSARDLVFDLENCSQIGWPGSSAFPAGALSRPKQFRLAAAGAAIAIVLISIVALALWKMRAPPAAPPFFRRLTFQPVLIQTARFTADGQTVVYSASGKGQPLRVHVLRTDRPESQALSIPNSELAGVSRTGEMMIILNSRLFDWTGAGILAQVPVLGGTPREIIDGVIRADCAPDGRLAVWRRTEKGVNQLEFPIGNVLYTSPKNIYALRVSPKGDRVAINISTGGQNTDIMVFGLDGSKRTLTSGEVWVRGMAWTPDGKEVWFSIPRVTEGGVPSIYGVNQDGKERLVMRTPGWPWLLDISRDGTVLLGLTSYRGGISVPIDGSDQERDLSWLDASVLADISSDGKAILFTEWNEGVQYKATAYMRSTDGSPAVRLGEGVGVAFSPRKDKVLAFRTGAKRRELILLPTGPGKTETLPNDLDSLWGGFLPDGRIVITAQTAEGPRMFIQARDGKPPRPLTPAGTAVGYINSSGWGAIKPISPDGQWILVFDRNQRALLYPLPSPAGDRTPRLAAGVLPGDWPAGWSADGRHIYVYQALEMPAKIYDVDLVTGERRLLREVPIPDAEGVFRMSPFLLMPDGRSFAYNYFRQSAMLYTATGLR